MALMECHYFSEALGLCMTMHVILPQRTQKQIGMKGRVRSPRHPTLYLLHGLSDDHSIWLRRTSIERYVAPLGLAVVMPAVHRSFYTNMKSGGRYWDYISREVPRVAREFFPLSDKREDTFVAGLSMGGYGAFKLALNHPDVFGAAASLSGALRMNAKDLFHGGTPEWRAEMRRVFGSERDYVDSENDLQAAARRLARSRKPRPRLFQCCGTEDFLYEQNLAFRSFVEPLGFDYTYEEEPGQHEWGYWDRKIQRVLQWLDLK